MVVSGGVNASARHALIRASGVPEEQFEPLYWADRHAHDEGKHNGITFWQKFGRDSGLTFTDDQIRELDQLDARMWTTFDPAMIAWQRQLKAAGLRTAILSNMGDSVLANMEREFDWLGNFDVLIWSYQLGIAKPDPAIYRHTLEKLGTRAEETLFLDDKRVNIEAAKALGMQAIEFTTVEKLREDLVAGGLDRALPLPEVS